MILNSARGLLCAAALFALLATSCAHGLGGEAIAFRSSATFRTRPSGSTTCWSAR